MVSLEPVSDLYICSWNIQYTGLYIFDKGYQRIYIYSYDDICFPVWFTVLISISVKQIQTMFHFGNGYFSHRWGILLFNPPPGSRARRLGWSQYMHECVGASQGYHGVVGGLGLGLGLAVGWLVGSWR